MTDFDALCKTAETIPAELYPEVLREKAREVLPALEAVSGSKIETFGNDFGFEDVKAVIENSKKEGRQLTEFTDALCDYFGLLSEELKDDLVLLSLLVCAVDGKVSKKEKRYLRQLIR